MLAFTTRIPLAVMITMGIKQWENRSAMPYPTSGICAMTCSKSSNQQEYENFLLWGKSVFKEEVFATIPTWEKVSNWQGKLIALCDYNASYTPGPMIWNEGYKVWWHLSNIKMLQYPIPCKGNVGMWNLPQDISCKLQQ